MTSGSKLVRRASFARRQLVKDEQQGRSSVRALFEAAASDCQTRDTLTLRPKMLLNERRRANAIAIFKTYIGHYIADLADSSGRHIARRRDFKILVSSLTVRLGSLLCSLCKAPEWW